MKRALVTFVAVLVSLALPGCEQEIADAPPEIRFGHDVCVHCNMIITDSRHAAASLVRVDGMRKALLFDDIGDMLDYHRANAGLSIERQFVHDHETKQWIVVTEAHFVHAPEVHTPMGSGILAYASVANARAAAEKNAGRLLTPPELSEFRASSDSASAAPCCESKAAK